MDCSERAGMFEVGGVSEAEVGNISSGPSHCSLFAITLKFLGHLPWAQTTIYPSGIYGRELLTIHSGDKAKFQIITTSTVRVFDAWR